MSFDGRIEAQITVPSGVSVSATTDLGTSTVTIPSGSYFWTSAGGNTGLLATIAAQLNASAPLAGYPRTAGAMNAAIGYGTWSAAWLCDEPSGSLGAVFGSPSLTANGGVTYGTAGPRGGADSAVGFGDASSYFSGGNVYNVTGTDDVAWVWVAKLGTPVLANFITKGDAGVGSGRVVVYTTTTNMLAEVCRASDGALIASASVSTSTISGDLWHVGIMTIDRATGMLRIGVQPLSGSAVVSGLTAIAASDTTSANNFQVGVENVATAPNAKLAALYVARGSAAAAGLAANLSTALGNLVNAINTAWSVSLSTGATGTGKVSLNVTPTGAVPPAWALSWTSTDLRDISGFAADIWKGYPRTAAEMATAVGYGTWTAAYLCNETSGSLAPAFGSTSLTAGGTPTYGAGGPRGGTDAAIGFSAGSDYFDGGDTYDVGATDDLAVLWVSRYSSAPAQSALFCKGAAAPLWAVSFSAGNGPYLEIYDGVNSSVTASASGQIGEWHVGIAVIDRSTGKIRIGTRGLSSGTTSIAAEVTTSVGSTANAGAFRVGATATGAIAATQESRAFFAIAIGSGAATGLSANLSTALANFAAMVSSQTGTKQVRGLWIPNCPIVLDGEPRRAPKVSDLRTTTSPTGTVLGLVGNTFYRHKNLKWSHVPKSQVWEQAALYTNGSWETFFNETQLGLGSTSWFTPCSPVQIYDHTGTLLGQDANSAAGLANGWQMTGVTSIEPRQSAGTNGWTGMFEIALPEIVSSG